VARFEGAGDIAAHCGDYGPGVVMEGKGAKRAAGMQAVVEDCSRGGESAVGDVAVLAQPSRAG
jgi:hypothetical protein